MRMCIYKICNDNSAIVRGIKTKLYTLNWFSRDSEAGARENHWIRSMRLHFTSFLRFLRVRLSSFFFFFSTNSFRWKPIFYGEKKKLSYREKKLFNYEPAFGNLVKDFQPSHKKIYSKIYEFQTNYQFF